MPRADLLRKLFHCYASHDDAGFRSVAAEIVAEARESGHNLVAEDLRAILTRSNGSAAKPSNGPSLIPLPRADAAHGDGVDVRQPRNSLENVVLSAETRTVIDRVLAEHHCQDQLATFNLTPARKLLFFGPPGCGKTLTAEAIAFELGLPFGVVLQDAVMSSYLGETSSNLRRVIDFAERTPCVLLFDEFDSIGKDRDDAHEVGELKRVVNSFLQMLDGYAGKGIIIAATNHESMLDSALWRRFDEAVLFKLPTPADIVQLLKLLTRGLVKSDITPSKLATGAKGLSHAEITDAVRASLKRMVLEGRAQIGEGDILAELNRLRGRMAMRRRAGRHQVQE